MAVKGLDIFKLSPKTNCKECGSPTCMAFCMKVAQGAVPIEKCPHMSDEAKALLSEATAPPMKTIAFGEHKLGGETVLFRHEKTFVSHNLFAVPVCTCMEAGAAEAKLAEMAKVDYERIGEREYVEVVMVSDCDGKADRLAELAQAAVAAGRAVIIDCADAEVAKAAVEAVKASKPILNGANKDNWEAMNALATANGVALGVTGATVEELYDTVAALEKAGNKNLVIDVTGADAKATLANAVIVRRTALKDNDRTFGYPSIVNLPKIAKGDMHMQAALAAMFTVKYGSIIVMESMTMAEALPLYGLRQNIFTDPQKPG